jgi:hypothetical protein
MTTPQPFQPRCGNCGAPQEDALIACPKCKISYRESQELAAQHLGIDKTAIAREATRLAYKRLTWLFVGGFTLWSVITGGGLWQIYAAVRDQVTDLIATKFDEPAVKATLVEVARTRASELMDAQLRPELEATKAALAKELETFKQANEFSQTVLLAQGEDRRAWDRLRVWANNPSHPYAAPAGQIWRAVLDAHDSMLFESYGINWDQLGVTDPSKVSVAQLEQLCRTPDPQIRAAFVDAVGQRQDVPKHERMRLLLNIARTEPNLATMRHAGHWFWQLAGQPGNALLVDDMDAWWAKNEGDSR